MCQLIILLVARVSEIFIHFGKITHHLINGACLPWLSFLMMLWALALIAVFSVLWASMRMDLIELFHCQERYRWGQFYPSLALGRMEAEPFKEPGEVVELINIVGWPIPWTKVTIHFDGSPLEAQKDAKVIQEHLNCLLEGRIRLMTVFVVLEGWVSQAFKEALEGLGYRDTEAMTIMTLEDVEPFQKGPLKELPARLEVRLIDNLDDFAKLIEYRPTPIQHVYKGFDLEAIQNPQMHSWGIFDRRSGDCVGTTQLFIHDPEAAILGMVSTAEAWRRLGLATHLVSRVIQYAIQVAGIRRVMLQSTPMAVGLYKRMGFEEVGVTTTFEYSLMEDARTQCNLI